MTVTPGATQGLSEDVAGWWRHAPALLVGLLDVLAVLAVVLVTVLITVDAIRHRRQALLAAVLAAVLAVLLATPAIAILQDHGSAGLAAAFARGSSSSAHFTAAFLAFLTGADLRSRRRWLRAATVAVVLLVLAGLAVGALGPVGGAIALVFGWLVGLCVRLALGVPPARPAQARVLAAVRAANLPVTSLEPTQDEAGLVRYIARVDGGRALDVTVVDRDRRDGGLFIRLWRLARLRTAAAGHPALTTRAVMERQALAGHVAAAGGARVAPVRALTVAGSDALVFVRDRVVGTPVSSFPVGSLPPAVVADAWRQLRLLHGARVAHRELTGDRLTVTSEQAVVLTGLSGAEVAASDLLIRLDVAQLLVTLALLAGAEPAVTTMRTEYPAVDPIGVAALLQPVALAPATRSALRSTPGLLAALRAALLTGRPEPTGPRPARIERFRPRVVLSVAGATVAAHVLLTQLSRTNPQEAIAQAEPGWAVVALLGSSVTFLGAAISLAAFTPIRLRVWRTAAVQLAASFLTLVTPPAVGQVALNVRYVQRAGLDPTTATATVALTQLGNLAGTLVLLLVGLALTGRGVSPPSLLPGGTLLVALVVAAVLLAAVIGVPPTRRLVLRWVLPQVRATLPRLLDVLGRPRRLAAGMSGNLLLTGGYVVSLDAALRAFGVHAALLEVAVVYLAGSAVGSAAPTPGGLGAVEAALVAGLAAIGVPASSALPAVLLFRTATFWLPVPPGWLAFSLLQRRGVV